MCNMEIDKRQRRVMREICKNGGHVWRKEREREGAEEKDCDMQDRLGKDTQRSKYSAVRRTRGGTTRGKIGGKRGGTRGERGERGGMRCAKNRSMCVTQKERKKREGKKDCKMQDRLVR